MTNRTRYLNSIATDTAARSTLVEDLRTASVLLTGEHRDYREATLARVSFRLARRLREIAQRLCDHDRIAPDGVCRYCEVVIEAPQ
jgi:hypothetical protein